MTFVVNALLELARTIDFSKAALFCSTKQTNLRLNKNKIVRSYIYKQYAATYEIEVGLLYIQKGLTTYVVN